MAALITKTDLIALKNLSSTNELVAIDQVPAPFKEDFDRFFYGKTLVHQDGCLFAYPADIRRWVAYVFRAYQR